MDLGLLIKQFLFLICIYSIEMAENHEFNNKFDVSIYK